MHVWDNGSVLMRKQSPSGLGDISYCQRMKERENENKRRDFTTVLKFYELSNKVSTVTPTHELLHQSPHLC